MNKSMITRMVPARKHLKLVLFCLVALSALVFLAACGGTTTTGGATPTTAPTPTPTEAPTATPTPTTAPTGPTQTVLIISDATGSFAFSPASLTIKAGTTVIWKNNTTAPHTVTSDDGKSFDSGSNTPIASGMTFSFTFKTAGTFPYHCSIHPFMKATIIVQ